MVINKRRDEPLISVIVPIFNVEMYLRRCLNSILNQSYVYLEILLIDDGSTDDSGKICDEYKLIDERIRVIHKLNEGTVSARKCGIHQAQGELISFIDGDDWIDSDMYEQMIDFYFHENCPNIISSGMIYEYPELDMQKVVLDGADEGRYNKKNIENTILPALICNFTKGQNSLLTSVCTKLIDKKVAQEAMQYMSTSLTLGEDGAYFYFLVACSESLAVTYKAFYHYEQHSNSQNFKYDIDSFSNLVELKRIMTEGMDKLGWNKRDQIQEQINYYVWGYLCNVIEKSMHYNMHRCIYLFPFAKCQKGSAILVYGAGEVGKSYIKCLEYSKFTSKIIWTDKNYKELQNKGICVVSVEDALKMHHDYIVIAIENGVAAASVKDRLLEQGVTGEKIILEKPVRITPYD